MPALLHTFFIFLSATGAYVWLQTPALRPYSLQAFSLAVLLYFIVKRLSNSKIWHVMPAAMSIETSLATFAFLLLIGATGNNDSIFFPMTYIHLFFIVFSSHPLTSFSATAMIGLFHYAMDNNFTSEDLGSLMTLPVILVFFLFAKKQHEEIIRDRAIIKTEEQELDQFRTEDQSVRHLLKGFLIPKQDQLLQLLENAEQNKDALAGQISLIKTEIERVLNKINKGD